MVDIVVSKERPIPEPEHDIELAKLRTIVQDSHLNFLVGAGTPSTFFGLLGDIENALTKLESGTDFPEARAVARASLYAYFFDKVLSPNIDLVALKPSASKLLTSYGRFAAVLNRILLRRRSTLLGKQINIFTTNVDLAFEVAMERLGIEFNDGFSGKISPSFDLGSFGSVRYRTGVRYEHRSEIPTFDLYKLHGSIGWQIADEDGSNTDLTFERDLAMVKNVRSAVELARTELVPIAQSGEVDAEYLLDKSKSLALSELGLAFVAAYERLVIVNPRKGKFEQTVLTENYYELIRRFANELERENSLLLVHGFSFRDEHLRKLVVRAARTNPTLQVLVFCYTARDRALYEALLPELDLPNGNLSYIEPHANPGEKEPTKLDLDRMVELYLAPLLEDVPLSVDQQIELVFKNATS